MSYLHITLSYIVENHISNRVVKYIHICNLPMFAIYLDFSYVFSALLYRSIFLSLIFTSYQHLMSGYRHGQTAVDD